jgi:hypothetical protein
MNTLPNLSDLFKRSGMLKAYPSRTRWLCQFSWGQKLAVKKTHAIDWRTSSLLLPVQVPPVIQTKRIGEMA